MPDDKPALESIDLLLRKVEFDLAKVQAALDKKEDDSKWYKNPLVLSITAGALALIGNIGVTWSNNSNTQNIEKMHAQSSLIFEAIKTGGNADATCKNLQFFVKLGLLESQ